MADTEVSQTRAPPCQEENRDAAAQQKPIGLGFATY
jgi:hypothetical protein